MGRDAVEKTYAAQCFRCGTVVEIAGSVALRAAVYDRELVRRGDEPLGNLVASCPPGTACIQMRRARMEAESLVEWEADRQRHRALVQALREANVLDQAITATTLDEYARENGWHYDAGMGRWYQRETARRGRHHQERADELA